MADKTKYRTINFPDWYCVTATSECDTGIFQYTAMKCNCTQTMFLGLLLSMLLVLPVRGTFWVCNLNCMASIELPTSAGITDLCVDETAPCHANGHNQSPESQTDSQSNTSDSGCECSFELQTIGMDDPVMPLSAHGFIAYSNLHVDSRELATVSPPPRKVFN